MYFGGVLVADAVIMKMEAIDLNDDGQNDVMDEYIEDHEVIEISEVNRGTQPKQVQSHRDESVEKTEEEKEEEDKEKKKEEESGEFRDLTEISLCDMLGDESVEKTEEEKEEEDKEKKKEEESGEFRDLTECVAIFFPSYRLKTSKEAGSWSKVNHDIREF
ncbi:hypothetical protein DY000_02040116 [Brassica cretica]|uniref:Uncharacterized protein n=1 Tax=Brassica cretica TaxID=69181 RepID=A0ABQ7B603_BRACR|nr:hypothetical protein DY000_02040116 [Brassica cretica]